MSNILHVITKIILKVFLFSFKIIVSINFFNLDDIFSYCENEEISDSEKNKESNETYRFIISIAACFIAATIIIQLLNFCGFELFTGDVTYTNENTEQTMTENLPKNRVPSHTPPSTPTSLDPEANEKELSHFVQAFNAYFGPKNELSKYVFESQMYISPEQFQALSIEDRDKMLSEIRDRLLTEMLKAEGKKK